jgi:hypothetical protein
MAEHRLTYQAGALVAGTIASEIRSAGFRLGIDVEVEHLGGIFVRSYGVRIRHADKVTADAFVRSLDRYLRETEAELEKTP